MTSWSFKASASSTGQILFNYIYPLPFSYQNLQEKEVFAYAQHQQAYKKKKVQSKTCKMYVSVNYLASLQSWPFPKDLAMLEKVF